MKVYYMQRLGFIILGIFPEHYGSILKKKMKKAGCRGEKASQFLETVMEVGDIVARRHT